MKPFTLSLANGAQLSGILSLPTRTSTTPHYQPLMVGVHGGTYFSRYFDAGGTTNSALRLAEILGVPFVSIDRPGYRESTGLPPVPHGSTFLQEEGKYLHRFILPKIWQEFGRSSGATTMVILAHSLGSPGAIVASALHAEEPRDQYPLAGLIMSGWGTVHGRPRESAQHIVEHGVVDGRIFWPLELKDGPMFGDPTLGRVSPEILAIGDQLNTSMSLGEFEDGSFHWSDYWLDYARRVQVPVMYGMGEHDALWKASRDTVHDFAKEFTKSPRVESGVVLGAPHCIELSYWGPGWVARCVGFAVECAAAEGVRSRAGAAAGVQA
ncbi:uncharacterized protein Z520_05575 [Fonsecaea multimorphosa CBS 102226]|uniref:AB hydrolase-1 domain-containing protein n=1 Tax=Fonsecaea multimorphosa CBS 102226 TaxID=1442371 RepID=A0A0D2K7G0_9EURO|nr:uncharacterized protein Z520_05575 [Fonsecaea multimorphosa CBS 102226]KIX99114.1 hypothetical protein Z520_05575 [Fonsecaea multimorphosa CBS 102226]OAL25376.1 hypothetical protein AYO22_05253 [Fonsecaea multimorphosa]